MDHDWIQVCVNGRERKLPSGLSVADLLSRFDLSPGLVVVERNREILSRDAYGAVEVSEGDVLELVHFVGGG